MKIYRLPQLADSNPDGTYLLGRHDIDSSAVYMIYGRLRPGDPPRKIAPAPGTEELVCVIKGSLQVKSGKTAAAVGPGEAFHLRGSDIFHIENTGKDEAVYIAAGGTVPGLEEAPSEKADSAPDAAPAAAETPAEEAPDFIITRERPTGDGA